MVLIILLWGTVQIKLDLRGAVDFEIGLSRGSFRLPTFWMNDFHYETIEGSRDHFLFIWTR